MSVLNTFQLISKQIPFLFNQKHYLWRLVRVVVVHVNMRSTPYTCDATLSCTAKIRCKRTRCVRVWFREVEGCFVFTDINTRSCELIVKVETNHTYLYIWSYEVVKKGPICNRNNMFFVGIFHQRHKIDYAC